MPLDVANINGRPVGSASVDADGVLLLLLDVVLINNGRDGGDVSVGLDGGNATGAGGGVLINYLQQNIVSSRRGQDEDACMHTCQHASEVSSIFFAPKLAVARLVFSSNSVADAICKGRFLVKMRSCQKRANSS